MRKRILFVFIFLFVVLLIPIISKIITLSPVLFQLIFNRDIDLKRTDDSINVLLLGTGGGFHEGPNLTDTIIFAKIDPIKNKVNLISIPRDLWIPELEQKINTAYAKGEDVRKGGGLVLAKATVSKVLNQPVSYGFRIDFDGFVKAIDLVGGLDIVVDREFDDYQYPVEEKREDLCGHTLEEATVLIASESAQIVFPCRYKQVHFSKGPQLMDGATSLMFVRSRYAVGPDGTDFARSVRQQKVIQAFREKVLSLQILLNPIKINDLYSVLSKSIDTDIQTSEFDDLIKLANKIRKASLQSEVLDVGDETKSGLLVNPSIDEFVGAWVLVPRVGNGNFSEVHKHVDCVLTKDNCPISSFYENFSSNKKR